MPTPSTPGSESECFSAGSTPGRETTSGGIDESPVAVHLVNVIL